MDNKSLHPVFKSFLIGSLSGTCSTILFQPLDLLKTRLQSQGSTRGGVVGGSDGAFSLMARIYRHEKWWGLWKGFTPSLTRCVPGVGLYFAAIQGLRMGFEIKGDPTGMEALLLGATGRSFSGILMIPFTVIKTRFESSVYSYGSMGEALRTIYGKEGVRGLTCGLVATLLRDVPFSGLYLLIYTGAKGWAGGGGGGDEALPPTTRFSAGLLAGIGASLITQPADVLKTKIQLYPNNFQSLSQVILYVHRKYGMRGYFKGLMPRMVRRTLIAAMSWTLYEQLVISLGLK